MKKYILFCFCFLMTTSLMSQTGTIINKKKTNKSKLSVKANNNNADKAFLIQSLEYKAVPKKEHEGLEVIHFRADGSPVLIEASDAYKKQDNDLKANVVAFLKTSEPLLGVNDAGAEFKQKTSIIDDLGMEHITFDQYYKGIPVYGAQIKLHARDGQVLFLNGVSRPTPDKINVQPAIEKQTSKEKVLLDVGSIQQWDNDKFGLFDFEKFSSELVIYYPDGGKEALLAWHHTVYKNLIERWEYFIDAHSGAIISKHESICRFHNHAPEKTEHTLCTSPPPPDGATTGIAKDLFGTNRDLNIYEVSGNFYLIDAARSMYNLAFSDMPNQPVGTIWTIDAFNTSPENDNFNYDHVISGTNDFPNKNAGVSAHYNGGKAYFYFKDVHGRESINGEGGNIVSLVNISDRDGSNLGNAFWNGLAMFYGNGDGSFLPLARGLDVAAHEMTHGVIQNTANLEYQGESGALNESFADIFGAMVDDEDWLIGEDVVRPGAFPSGALRSLSDPHNGAANGNFQNGWQPKHYNERYTGSLDNGGVHINSGIVNHAFYLFATDNAVGKERAEQVYYRALEQYLVKSSQFIDARIAVVKAAGDLYGNQVVSAAEKAFADVGIGEGPGGDYQTDIEVNPGDDLILFTEDNRNNLYIFTADGQEVFNPLTQTDPASKPSVNDDGTEIVFVGNDGHIYNITIDWSTSTPTASEQIISANPIWSNAVISRDGRRVAAVESAQKNEIFVFDFDLNDGVFFELYNPTFTEGINTGDVLDPDAMQFDFSGEYVMYDAVNEISSNSSGSITYWDIGFIKVWNNTLDIWSLGQVQKLFSALPEGISVGNPAFSKNSSYIVAFDHIDGTSAELSYSIRGANIETGDTKEILRPGTLGYPDYSRSDEQLICDFNNQGNPIIAITDLEDNKIESVPNTAFILFNGAKWGTWFSNGERILSDTEDPEYISDHFTVFPNPTDDIVEIKFEADENVEGQLSLYDSSGKKLQSQNVQVNAGQNTHTMSLESLPPGIYIIRMNSGNKIGIAKVVKQ